MAKVITWLVGVLRKGGSSDAQVQGEPSVTELALASLSLLALLFVLALALFALGYLALGEQAPMMPRLRVFAVGFIATAASFLCGGAIGFVFAIPRATAIGAPGQTATAAATRAGAQRGSANPSAPGGGEAIQTTTTGLFSSNSNLEKVSDWLTTILVGITLTQFDAIAIRLDRAGFALSCELVRSAGSACPKEDLVVGHGIIIFGGVLGFLWLYLWTRRYLIAEWTRGVIDAFSVEQGFASSVRDGAVASGTVQARAPESAREPSADAKKAAAGAAGAIERRVEAEETEATPKALRWQALLAQGVHPNEDPKSDDPWRGNFGTQSQRRGFRLEAYVSPKPIAGESHSVRASVTAPVGTVGNAVRFFLHPTFPQIAPVVAFDSTGVAKLDMIAYGAFTIGAAIVADPSAEALLLELDLVDVDAPADFKQR